ncbi:MAG TPA: HAD family phosphatase [Bacteroidales bacterium]|nr:HAD family phosphatase [Bacteroidales bacterium]HPI68565.1 HAD family phosphatase [Bacteroidales bacterium]HPR72512.1 HAD family phosphatase [Bacteroidales bacterium]HRW85797.1 HAD family phosphatase [Bacteroidales bacterium]
MIRNLVFDIGNVLISWKPGEYLLKAGYEAESVQIIVDSVFRSSHWHSLDNGDITRAEAIDLMASSSSITRDQIASLFDLCQEIIFPLTDNIKLLPELKKEGFRLYYLSNFPLEFFSDTKNRYDFFKYFDGGIISAEVRHSKPDPEIYKILLDRYGLAAEECLYIDDIEENVRSAESSGMKAIHLSYAESLEKELSGNGITLLLRG